MSSVRSLYQSYYTTTPLASPSGSSLSFSGSTLTVNTKTKFWSSTDGAYYISALLIEDKVPATQNGRSGTVDHHYILRGSMAPDLSPFGTLLRNGIILADTEFDQSFSMTIPESWVRENLSVILVVYKKEGTNYKFINTIKAGHIPTSNENINQDITNVNVYPNPSNGEDVNLDISLTNSNSLSINVYDLYGRVV